MSQIVIEGVRKVFSTSSVALDGIDLEIRSGELVVMLGPSGCGKTTMLRSVAGLETPDAGRIVIGDKVVFDAASQTDTRSEKRDVGMVFQNYALWPHMTVRRNIGYPLKAKRMTEELKGGAVERIAELVGCEALLDRYPAQLSGGQQQRVALARAMVSEPAVILFDEPLSNLDAKLRRELRTEIRRLHSRTGFTGIYVTHDQSEALAIGDRVALLSAGRLVQIDTPANVYRRPKSAWAADFMGLANELELEWSEDRWRFEGRPVDGFDVESGGPRVVRVRPTGCRIVPPGTGAEPGAVRLRGGRVDLSTFASEWVETQVMFGSRQFHVHELSLSAAQHTVGDEVDVVIADGSWIDFGAVDAAPAADQFKTGEVRSCNPAGGNAPALQPDNRREPAP
jgi:iron(III) transport system ATP-binding protein